MSPELFAERDEGWRLVPADPAAAHQQTKHH